MREFSFDGKNFLKRGNQDTLDRQLWFKITNNYAVACSHVFRLHTLLIPVTNW